MIKSSLPKGKALLIITLIFVPILMSKVADGAGLADSPWPVFGGNQRHTSLSPYDLGKEKKELLWNYRKSGGAESSPVIGSDGTIYIGSHDGYLYAFSKDGTLRWKYKLGEPVYDQRWNVSKAIMATPAIAKDGTVYINDSSNYLHAVNPDGTEKWRFPVRWHNDFWNGPNIGPDGTIYIGTARYDDNEVGAGLYAVNPDGTEKWHYLESSGVTIVPAVGNDGTVYFGAADPQTNRGKVIALTKDGKKKWQFDLEQWLEGSASIGDDGTIYSGSKEGNVYAINPDGTEKWRFKTGGGISATPTVGNDGKIYIGSWDGNLYALSQKDGKEEWRFDVKPGRDPKLFEGYPGKETICTNAALSKDGVLVFADVFDSVYGVDINGKELWRWKSSDGGGFVSSPSIGEDGTIYIGMYALGKKTDKQATGSVNNQKITSNLPLREILSLAGIIITVILIGITYVFYRKKKLSKKTLLIIISVILTMLVVGATILFILPKKDFEDNDSKSKATEREEKDQPGNTEKPKGEDSDFIKNATRVPGLVEVLIREFGEVGRSCAGRGCGGEKDTCVRWNKTKDECYETVKTKPATSDRYKIYCNMVVVNQDKTKTANISLNLNYTTADGVKNLVNYESFTLKPGTGNSLGWSHEVEEDNIGTCGYSDISVSEANN